MMSSQGLENVLSCITLRRMSSQGLEYQKSLLVMDYSLLQQTI